MPFEGSPNDPSIRESPSGKIFGIEGWTYGQPEPKSITFFLDNTAMVCDQYGRPIRRAVLNDGKEIQFADTPPDASREGEINPRPQFATHAQTLAALKAEGYDWTLYEVKYVMLDGRRRTQGRLPLAEALKRQIKLIQEGNRLVTVGKMVESAGWPQISYEELKQLQHLPPTPVEELLRILDPKTRRDAVKIKTEQEDARHAITSDLLSQEEIEE